MKVSRYLLTAFCRNLPKADLLVLVRQVGSHGVVVVVGLDGAGGCSKVVLDATGRGQVGEVARKLGHLSSPRGGRKRKV